MSATSVKTELSANFTQGDTQKGCRCDNCNAPASGNRGWWRKTSYEYDEWEVLCRSCAVEWIHQYDDWDPAMFEEVRMSVRAKFIVSEKTQTKSGFAVKLEPVIGGSPENEQFYKYTPGGKIELSTINVAAADKLIVGQECYVDFTPVVPAV